MKKRMVWLVVTYLMVLSLVLAACAPKVTEEKKAVTEEKKAVTEEKKTVTEEKKAAPEKKEAVTTKEAPQYGGTLNLLDVNGPQYGFTSKSMLDGTQSLWYVRMAGENLVVSDRLKGPAGGTGKWSGLYSLYPPSDAMRGNLAESWEIIQPDTLVFHIRKGVHWQNKPPTNGAELTADDVVYSFVLAWATPGSAWPTSYPYIADVKNPEKSIYVDPNDPWAVVMKAAPDTLQDLWERVASYWHVLPKALGPIAEGKGYGSWQGVVGTGPFLLTDYVAGSSVTYQRNPNYWQKDPLHPENQLPYVDGVRVAVIPDMSAQQAALRTGKIDMLGGSSMSPDTEQADSLMKTNPELQRKEKLGTLYTIFMRNDVKPFDNVNVRRALRMALNYDEMVKDYYGGKAEKFYWPAFPVPETSDLYAPLEKMPASVQELYSYNPDKAKKLLDEAGLPGPNRFTTSVIVSSTNEQGIDLLSLVKAYWAKVGVNLEIDVKEDTVFSSMAIAFSYKQGYFGAIPLSSGQFTRFTHVRFGSRFNYARLNEPLIESTLRAASAAYWERAKFAQIIREATPALHDLANLFFLPAPYIYYVWQPWIKGYYGESTRPYFSQTASAAEYAWIDHDLKKSMGH